MTVAEALTSYLQGVTAVTTLVGRKIFQAPAHELELPPYVVFMRSGRQGERDIEGNASVEQTYFDVESRGLTQQTAEAVGDAIRTALHGTRGTWGSLRVQGAFVDDQDDDYLPIPPGKSEAEVSVLSRVQIITG